MVRFDRRVVVEYGALLLIAVLAVLYTFPVGEGDFFFHVKTGQWIWEHHSLPVRDPFNFPLQGYELLPDDARWISFVLKQYWLGQLLLYVVWSFAGEAGMVILRACSYSAILLFVFWWLRRRGFGLAEVVSLFLTGNIMLHYSAERPQLFAFMLLPLLLFLLESARCTAAAPSRAVVWYIPLTVVLWSNIHGSYVLALPVIGVYAIDHLVSSLKSKSRPDTGLLALLAGSILVSGANPSGWDAFWFSFNFLKIQASRTAEFTSPVTMALQHHVIDYYYWALVLVVLIMVIRFWRRLEPVHAVVVVGLLLLSFKGTRYVPFFALASPLLCFSLPVWRPAPKATAALGLLLAVWIATADYRNVFKFRAEKSFPAAATRFLATVHPQGNLFNYVTWGGYILCHTDNPVFVDTRNLVKGVVDQHDMVLAGINWQEVLDSYNIQTIIIPGTDPISCRAFPLLIRLLTAPQWVLIYADDVALVLVRSSAANRQLIEKYALSSDRMTEHILSRWKWQNSNEL